MGVAQAWYKQKSVCIGVALIALDTHEQAPVRQPYEKSGSQDLFMVTEFLQSKHRHTCLFPGYTDPGTGLSGHLTFGNSPSLTPSLKKMMRLGFCFMTA